MALERFLARVRGRVQMVGFRAFVIREAQSLGVAGTVRNLSDGSVEVVAEGESAELERLLQALRRGPGAARVDDVEVVRQPASGNLPPMRMAS